VSRIHSSLPSLERRTDRWDSIHSALPPPIQPRSAEDTYRHGSLSDYSDYDSSDAEDDTHYSRQPTSTNSDARNYAAYVQDDDRVGGKGKGLLAQEEEDDPFADPFADENGGNDFEVMTPGISDKRMEWKEV